MYTFGQDPSILASWNEFEDLHRTYNAMVDSPHSVIHSFNPTRTCILDGGGKARSLPLYLSIQNACVLILAFLLSNHWSWSSRASKDIFRTMVVYCSWILPSIDVTSYTYIPLVVTTCDTPILCEFRFLDIFAQSTRAGQIDG